MAFTYTLAYQAIARNVSPAQLAAAWALVPQDPAFNAGGGFTPVSDVTAPAVGNQVVRTIKLSNAAGTLAADVTNKYSASFGKALATQITASPVTVV